MKQQRAKLFVGAFLVTMCNGDLRVEHRFARGPNSSAEVKVLHVEEETLIEKPYMQ